MKRGELLRHLHAHGCELLREGGRHSWWHNPNLNKRYSGASLKEIVSRLGVRDVSTVSHGVKRAEVRLRKNQEFRGQVAEVLRKLSGSHIQA